MIDHLQFRLATPADRALVLALLAEYREADAQPQAPELVAAAVDRALAGEPLVRIYLIELDEAIGYLAVTIGFSIEVGGNDSYIDELYVRDAYRGRGIGTRALAFGFDIAVSLGARRVCLEVEHDNERARACTNAMVSSRTRAR